MSLKVRHKSTNTFLGRGNYSSYGENEPMKCGHKSESKKSLF